ncbi:glycoside hydrolase family 99-like domain-containing protein [Aeromonas caviae]|uniref:glycosyltransferase WbsX family protein n=1 Tax=Aeromonas caviae TaxID=648 RepID=UPI0030144BDE
MSKYKIFPFYFPQFHAIPENDTWWGCGFTDWDLVKKANPVSKLQYQPRVPINNNYYDQAEKSTIVEQAALAKRYGISGFNFYHYWFDGKPMLDKPVNNLLENNSIDIEYFFTWANETWTRQWVGKPNDILIKQNHIADPQIWSTHFQYLSKFFADPRYLKINNKPVFCIYRAELINKLDEFMAFFNSEAKKNGFNGIHFIALRAYDVINAEALYRNFDAIVNFQPRYSINKYLRKESSLKLTLSKIARRLPEFLQLKIATVLKSNKYNVFSYDDYLDSLKVNVDLQLLNKPVYQVAFPDWDNAPRYAERATFFSDTGDNKFINALNIIKSQVSTYEEKLVFINAWNEWSEGAYLEPDSKKGYSNLESVNTVFKCE